MEQGAARDRSGGGTERANVLLAVALVLAALVVLAAASLTLAPTGSDGITGESVSETDLDVVEEGLRVAFVESNDTLDPAYQPSFEQPEREGPAPIDYDTVEALLESEPFTREQVVQTQSLMASLANRRLGGTIASLEPVANATRTGTLVRLGNDEAHDFGGDETVLVENASAVQDLEIALERETLPFTPENATTVGIGDWTLAAYQDVETNRVNYQLGEHEPAGEWRQTAAGADLQVNVHERTINGVPVDDGVLAVDPGEPPFSVVVEDTRWAGTPPEFPGTHGGVNLVAVDATPDDVGDIPAKDWQEVVTRAVLDVTYVDSTTTFVDRTDVDAAYTYFEYEDSDAERDPRVGIDTGVETVTFGGKEGVFVNDTDGAALTTEVQYWNGTTETVTDETDYGIPADYEGTATLDAGGDGPAFVPLLYLPDDDHEVESTYEIATQDETHTFEETLPVTVINPIASVTVDIETATVGDVEGIMPLVQEASDVAVTGEFIDGRERPIADHPDIALDLQGSQYVEMDAGENVTLSPVAPTPDGNPVELDAAFLPTPSYEQSSVDPLVAGTDSEPVVDPVQDIGVDIANESQDLPLSVDSYVLTDQSYNVTATAWLVNNSLLEVSGSDWLDYSFLPPHQNDSPATLHENGTDVVLEPDAVTAPGTPLTLEGQYTFGEGVSDTDTVAVLDLVPTGLSVDIGSDHLTISGTANVSVGLSYAAAGAWPDNIAVEPPPSAVESCETTYVISAACSATPYQVTGEFHGQGVLDMAVDEGAVLDVSGGQFVDSDVVTVGLTGGAVPFEPPIPPHRAKLDVFEATDDTSNPNGTHRGRTARFNVTRGDLLDVGDPFGWMDKGIEVYDNATASVLADLPTQVRATANLEAADEYDIGNRSIPPYLTGDFTGPGSTCVAGCWELSDVSFDGGTFESTDPFNGPEYRTEGFIPREEGVFDVTSTVTYLDVPEEVAEKYEQAGMGDIAEDGVMDVPVLGDLTYNVTLNEEALYDRGEGEFSNTEVLVEQDDDSFISADTTLENVGSKTGLFDIEFDILGSTLEPIEKSGYKLNSGETVSSIASFNQLPEPGAYTAWVTTRGGNATDSVTFEVPSQNPEPELSNLDIAGQGDNATIVAGDDEDIAVDVKNVGNSPGTFEININIADGTVTNIQETDTLEVGKSETIVFESVTGNVSADENYYEVKISVSEIGFDAIIGTLTVTPSGECADRGCYF